MRMAWVRFCFQALVDEGCRHLFVAQLEEAISLRAHIAKDAAIYVMQWFARGLRS